MKRVKDKICPRIRDKLESIRKNTRHLHCEAFCEGQIPSKHVQ